MILVRTLKWQIRKWLVMVGVQFLVFVPFLLILALVPVPQEGRHNAYYVAVNSFAMPIALISLGLFGVYMMFIYPFFTAFGKMANHSLIEHQHGHPFIYILSTRLLLNICTFLLGIGVLRVAWQVMHRFEGAGIGRVDNMLADYFFFAELFPMIFVFTLTGPLILLMGITHFDNGSRAGNKSDIWDFVGILSCLGLSWFSVPSTRDLHWVIQVFIALPPACIAIILTARSIDRCSEVNV